MSVPGGSTAGAVDGGHKPPPVLTFDELASAEGLDLGSTDWIEIHQRRIDSFADATDDHQWIHVEPARAADSPFGGTIAHGYLTLGVAGARLGELLRVEGASRILNYGVDRARFPAPLPSGSRIRVRASITTVSEVAGGLQVSARVTADAEGVARPVCVADVQIRYLR